MFFSNIEIQRWCEEPSSSTSHHLFVYIGFSIAGIVVNGARIMTIVMSTVRFGQAIHKKVIKSLLYASITQFYNRVPLGRIVNRLSKDVRQIDEEVGFYFTFVLEESSRLINNLVICLYASTPLITIPIVIITGISYKFQQYYLKSQRECARLDNVSASPIVSGFTSGINGVSTIRAYNLEEEFFREQAQKVDTNKRMRIMKIALENWFAMRLSFFSFFVSMTAIGYSIFSQN